MNGDIAAVENYLLLAFDCLRLVAVGGDSNTATIDNQCAVAAKPVEVGLLNNNADGTPLISSVPLFASIPSPEELTSRLPEVITRPSLA